MQIKTARNIELSELYRAQGNFDAAREVMDAIPAEDTGELLVSLECFRIAACRSDNDPMFAFKFKFLGI